MKAQELSRKYAAAVFSLALEKWLASLNTVNNKLAGNSMLIKNLQNAERPFSERQKELDLLIPAEANPEVRNLLYLMLREGDISLVGDVITELERMMRGGPLVQVARVTTAVTLAEDEMEQFRQKIRAKYGENLEFDFTVDPAIIGGAVVQVGDKVIDGSIANRLTAMSNVLGVKG